MRIGERIKKFREVRNMSQQDLSSAAGVSLGLIQQIEQGRHNNPSINVLEKMAGVLEIDVINLIRDPVDIKLSGDKIEDLKKKVKLAYVPLMEDIPTDEEIGMKKTSRIKALVPIANNRAEYVLHINKEYSVRGMIRRFDYLGLKRTKMLKDTNMYLFQTLKDKKYHVGLCKMYDGGKAFFRSQDIKEEPIEYSSSNVKIIGEVVSWLKSSLNDSQSSDKISI